MNGIDLLLSEFASNDVLSGVVGGSLFASLLYLVRGIPGALWGAVQWRFSCSLTVFNEDGAFERVNEWLSSLEYTKRCRRLRMTVSYDDERGEAREVLAPGIGKHLIWYRGRPVLIDRSLPDQKGVGGWRRTEDIRIVTIGRSPELLRELIQQVSDARKRSGASTIEVFLYRRRWRLACRKAKRPLDTVTLPESQKRAIVEDAERFLESRGWYADRGVPYRRGYLFEGPPGCGKTTLAMALAGHLGRPIYALNLGSIGNDDELIDAVCEVPEHGVLLIEDIDAAEIGQRRGKSSSEPAPTRTGEKVPEEKRVTLSGLLNVLDGVFARDGRILVMTTNHPEKVDPALLRPGRADRREYIGELGSNDVLAMCERFLSRREAEQFAAGTVAPIAPAALQERLLRARGEVRE